MSNEAFEIYEFKGHTNGMLAICKQPHTEPDFEAVADWTPDVIVTMTSVEEFEREDFAAKITACAPQWMQVTVSDFGVPESDLEEVVSRLSDVLSGGGRVLIHCKGGQGRSGMLCMRLLVDQGEAPKQALARIRQKRAGAVETDAQEIWASNQPSGA